MERLLFEVVEELARHKVPAVFKGAVMLNHILRLNRIYSPQRGTIDIDLSWEADEDEGIIENRLNYILGNLELKGFSVECKRRFSSTSTAGFRVYLDGEFVFNFDVERYSNNSRPIKEYTSIYQTKRGVQFVGVSIYKICADKVSVISTDKILRRAKDILDIYSISQLKGITLVPICNVIEYDEHLKNKKIIGNFNCLIQTDKVEQLEHAYSRLSRVKYKPPFRDVYRVACEFCKPFTNYYYKDTDMIWDNVKNRWMT